MVAELGTAQASVRGSSCTLLRGVRSGCSTRSSAMWMELSRCLATYYVVDFGWGALARTRISKDD